MEFDIREGTIGDSHDPYGETTLVVTVNPDLYVRWYWNGLLFNWCEVHRAGSPTRRIEWNDGDRIGQLKGEILFRLTTGISPYDALERAYEEMAESMANDPFHGSDPYYGHA